MTSRLYFDDPYQVTFEAHVIERTKQGEKEALVLDQTCFYPTSGGQERDYGTLNGVDVIDVIAQEDQILHIMDTEIEEDVVRGQIDWNRRFDFMQQHSGQHLLSRSFLDVLNANTVSSHLGEEFSTIELDREILSTDEAVQVETYANGVVFEDRPIQAYIVDEKKASELPLRRSPKKEGPVRIVEFENLDFTPCGGTHCRRTGEIGLIKTGRWEKIRGHVRIQFLCGSRALSDYRWKNRVVEILGDRYSTRGEDLPDILAGQAEEMKDLRRQLKDLSGQAMEYEIQELLGNAITIGSMNIVKAVFQGRSKDELKNLAVGLTSCGSTIALLGNRDEKAQLVFSSSPGISLKMNDLIGSASEMLGGRGGGTPDLAFGGGPGKENIDEIFDTMIEHIRKEL